MDMEEIKAEVGCLHGQVIGKGRILWKKNQIDFFGAANWLVKYPKAKVFHVERQTSDHCLLMLETNPAVRKFKNRF